MIPATIDSSQFGRPSPSIWDDFLNATGSALTSINFGTELLLPTTIYDRHFGADTSLPHLIWLKVDPQEFEELEDTILASATAANDNDAPLAHRSDSAELTELDEAMIIVREFGLLSDGWNEPDTPAPSADKIDDALVVLQNWPLSKLVPEPCVGPDGRIALELYDADGFTFGGIELIGDHRAIFSIVKRSEILDKGAFDTTFQVEIIQALSRYKALLEAD